MASAWSLCVCGEVQKIFGVLVKETSTVLELKNAIERKSSIPRAEQTLFFQEKLMQDDLDLSSYSGLGDGAVIYLIITRTPLLLRIYNLQHDTPVEFTVKFGQEVLEQSVQAMKTAICDTADAILDSSILLCDGEVLEEKNTVSDYPAIKDGAKIILQKQPVVVSLQRQQIKFKIFMPQGIDARFLNQWIFSKTGDTQTQLECKESYNCNEEHGLPSPYVSRDCNIIKKSGWILDVQRIDGNKVSVYVPERMSTPIVVLKEYIEKTTGVCTHQQRLTFGSTVLEDWDHDDNMMFIGHYPAIQNGSLIHIIIVQTKEVFQMKVKRDHRYYKEITLRGTKGLQVYIFRIDGFYINISHNEGEDSVEKKIKDCTQCLYSNLSDYSSISLSPGGTIILYI